MRKKLYARDVLTFKQYKILHEHLVDMELYTFWESTDKRENEAFENASYILKTEPVEELVEYDLQHVLNYNANHLDIVEKMERAVEREEKFI